MFLIFVGLQAVYLFGGIDTFAVSGHDLQRLCPPRLLRADHRGVPRRRGHRP
jgi:hypothetical protein